MKRALFATLTVLSLLFSSTPALEARPVSPIAIQRNCLAAAQAPVTQASGYRNGDARHKEVLRNGYNPDVSAMSALCVRLDGASPVQGVALAADCQSLIGAQIRRRAQAASYLRPFAAACSAMTGRNIVLTAS